jgi:alkylhydroperoxidase family enzyme
MVYSPTTMSGRHAHLLKQLADAVLASDGSLAPDVRRAIAERGAVPEALADYVRKVHEHAYKVTDEDIAALVAAGYSEDAIFEATVSAAVGSGLVRLQAGLAAMKKKQGP